MTTASNLTARDLSSATKHCFIFLHIQSPTATVPIIAVNWLYPVAGPPDRQVAQSRHCKLRRNIPNTWYPALCCGCERYTGWLVPGWKNQGATFSYLMTLGNYDFLNFVLKNAVYIDWLQFTQDLGVRMLIFNSIIEFAIIKFPFYRLLWDILRRVKHNKCSKINY